MFTKTALTLPQETLTISQAGLPDQKFILCWEKLPEDFTLEDEPVDNINHPLIAGALNEALEVNGHQCHPHRLIGSDLAVCVTVNGKLVVKGPDWFYVRSVLEKINDRRSYTPKLQGETPLIVMEFLSENEEEEYSKLAEFPFGKWFFYEQILQVPYYVIFKPQTGLLEFYRLIGNKYQLELPDYEGRNWIPEMGLFLGTWRGEKELRYGYWLRWWDDRGNLLLWAVELNNLERQRAEMERQRANQAEFLARQVQLRVAQAELEKEQERLRADQAQLRADRLAEYLRSQGIDPSQI